MDKEKQTKNCPKCGAARNVGPECLNCGVIYSKVDTLKIEDSERDQEPQQKKRKHLKFIIVALLAIILSAIAYNILERYSDSSDAVNLIITMDAITGDFDKAQKLVNAEYVEKSNRDDLAKFWTLYLVLCQEESCPKVIIDTNFKISNELTAYNVVKKATLDILKAPATAVFEKKEYLSHKTKPEGVFSFTYYVDSQNGFGALVRSKCSAVVTNVGKSSWYPSRINCE